MIHFVATPTLREIGNEAFHNCEHLRIVVLNEGLKTVGAYAFANTNAKTVRIPNTVRVLAFSAFYNCKLLKALELPP